MKKLLSSILAATLVASMASVAFAADTTSIRVDSGSRLFKTDTDGVMHEVTGDLTVKPGQTFFVEILPENPGETITSKIAGQYKVITDWKQSKDVFDGASIENKKISVATGKYTGTGMPFGMAASYETKAELDAAIAALTMHDDATHPGETNCDVVAHYTVDADATQEAAALAKYKAETKNEYRYFAAIKTKSSYTTKSYDLIGSVKVAKKTTGNTADVPTNEINAVVKYEQTTVAGDTADVSKDAPVVNFDDADGDVELLFGSAMSFTVNAKAQDELYLGYSEKPNTKVIDQNPDANIDFISFQSKPTFNRIGEVRLFADEDCFVYEVTSNGLKKVKAKYDEDYEAYVFDTRTLGEYAVSDVELEFAANEDNSNSSSTPEVKPEEGTGNGGSTTDKPHNPNTGSNDMVNVAVAVAVVSLAAAGAVATKKASK